MRCPGINKWKPLKKKRKLWFIYIYIHIHRERERVVDDTGSQVKHDSDGLCALGGRFSSSASWTSSILLSVLTSLPVPLHTVPPWCCHRLRDPCTLCLPDIDGYNYVFRYFPWSHSPSLFLYHEGLIDEALLRWLSFWRVLPSLQRASEAVLGEHQIIGHPTEQGPSCLVTHLVRRPTLWQALLSHYFYFTITEATVTVLLGTLRALEMVLYPCPDQCLAMLLLLGSIASPLDYFFFFFFLCWRAVRIVGPYSCESFYVQWTQFSTIGLIPSCRHIYNWSDLANLCSHSKGSESFGSIKGFKL